MSIADQARKYIDAIPSAISGNGGHSQTFSVAMVLVEGFAMSAAEARPLMAEYAARCDPPWSEREIDHKLADAESRVDSSKRGKLIRKGVKYKAGASHYREVSPVPTVRPKPELKSKSVRYEVSDAIELPEPIKDGTRLFLKAAFDEGEGIRIAVARTNEERREVPKDAGVTLSREEWLRKLDEHHGNPNKFLKTSERNGIFISVNPMRVGGSRDSDVTAFRHALLEFDNISVQEQWGIIQQSRAPCTAIISSGGKSIHAWVRVDSKDRNEFNDRVKALYQHFEQYKPDEKNKNPSRFSRLPNCERGNSRQELLAISTTEHPIGCESFAEWLALQQVESGETWTADVLRDFDSSKDENCLIGTRYIGRGMACLIVGPSGVGKSSLNTQLAILWALGRPAFGIAPQRPLKSLVFQAENDMGDASEMFNGVCTGLGIEALSDEQDLIDRNFIIHTDIANTGPLFLASIPKVIERHKPDVIWLDPVLSFVGADISRQEVVASFFRNGLNPILKSSGVACFCIHHTGKPPSDKSARQHWQTSDFAYAGLGSSDLTNWARAVMVLQDRGQGVFELKLAKRGKRAGVTTADGMATTSLWLRHSSKPEQIFWEQTEAPAEESTEPKERKLTKPEQIAGLNLGTFLSQCPKDGEGLREIVRRLSTWLASKDSPKKSLASCADGTLRTAIALLLDNEKLRMADNRYLKGDKA
jgi:RecA-family ATPase